MSSKRLGVGLTTSHEEMMSGKEKIINVWQKFLTTKLGVILNEHTPLVRAISEPQARFSSTLFPTIILLLVTLLLALFSYKLLATTAFILCLLVFAAQAVFWWVYKDDEQRFRDDLNTRKDLLRQHGAIRYLSAQAVSKNAEHAVPMIRDLYRQNGWKNDKPLPARWTGVHIGVCHGVSSWVWSEQPLYLLAPARSGKTTNVIIPMVMECAGAVVTTSSRRDVVDATWHYRSKGWFDPTRWQDSPNKPDKYDKPLHFNGGNTYLFDPMNVAARTNDDDLPPRLIWNPIARCIKPEVARACAETMVSTVSIGGDNAAFAKMSVDIVQALLLAAALENKSLVDVYSWSQSYTSCQIAANILLRHPEHCVASQWAQNILVLQHDDPRLRGSKMFGVGGAFSALSLPQVQHALCPKENEKCIDLEEFVQSTDTVYLLCDLKPDKESAVATGAGAFMAMFLTQVRDAARRVAPRLKGGRLQPPLAFILDEIANIEPWTELPQLFTAGTGEGIWSVACFQSRKQAEDAYEKAEGQMWDSSHKIILGGLSLRAELDEISELTGKRRVKFSEEGSSNSMSFLDVLNTSIRSDRYAVIEPDEIRRIPTGMALILHSSHKPAIISLLPYYKRAYKLKKKQDGVNDGK